MRKKIGFVQAVLVGKAAPYTRPGTYSAIDKRPIGGEVKVHDMGIDGDEQGDKKYHGGYDKAVHFYASEHYKTWREELGNDIPILHRLGGFGENISTIGITEKDLCIGDKILIGDAQLEVTQTRQPCWKLNDRFLISDMAKRTQNNGMTGYYCRVNVPGIIESGNPIFLIDRPYPEWSLDKVISMLYEGGVNEDLLKDALEIPLPPSWKKLIHNRLDTKTVEDWEIRLKGYYE